MKSFFEKGSSPLDLVLTVTLLLLPVAPMSLLAAQLGDQLSADSIARNALRQSVLLSPKAPYHLINSAIADLARQWKKEVASYRLQCSLGCQILTLEVVVGNARGVHSVGVEP